MSVKIIEAQTTDMETVRDLFRAYQAWLNVDICFQGFEQELATLPGHYAAPKGVIYIAIDENNAIACGAIRPVVDSSENSAELKRLFVHEDYRGKGIGKKIFNALMASAEEMGYDSIVLETLPIMKTAKSMYLNYGFERVAAYNQNADSEVEFYRYQFDKK